MCQGFSNFSGFLHHFISAKLATSSIRAKVGCIKNLTSIYTYIVAVLGKELAIKRDIYENLNRKLDICI